MEHPPKQGLKRPSAYSLSILAPRVLMEHPPKQGLKPININSFAKYDSGF